MDTIQLSREELFDLVWQKPFSHLAKDYQISDSGLRKVCLRLKIPLPSQGHWARLKLGKTYNKPSLPEFRTNEIITLQKRQTGDQIVSEKIYRQNQIAEEIKTLYQPLISESEFEGDSHPLIKSLEKDLGKRKGDSYGKFRGLIESSEGQFDVRFSRKIQEKAVRFLKKFLYIIDQRGHKISFEYRSRTGLNIGKIKLIIALREKLKINTEKDRKWDTPQYDPTGILTFQYDGYTKKEWTDEKESLDAQLPKIIAYLEEKAYERNLERMKDEERQRVQEDIQRKKQQLLYLKKSEFKNFEKLVEEANRWKQSQILREFITHISGTSKEPDEAWIKWALGKAAWLDPTTNHEDELLGKYPPEFPK